MLRILKRYISNLLGKQTMPLLSAGAKAPAFRLITTRGERFSLSEGLARGPVLLAFFKVSCPTCQFTFPFLQRLFEQLRGDGVQIWGIVQDQAKNGALFAEAFGVTFPVLVDDSPYKVSQAYGLTHVPSLFLVQPDGNIEHSGHGFSKADVLAIQHSLAQAYSAVPPALFLPTERIPEFKPG